MPRENVCTCCCREVPEPKGVVAGRGEARGSSEKVKDKDRARVARHGIEFGSRGRFSRADLKRIILLMLWKDYIGEC